MCGRSALAEDSMRLVRNILDLNTGHGAIMALPTPQWKRTTIGKRGRSVRGERTQ